LTGRHDESGSEAACRGVPADRRADDNAGHQRSILARYDDSAEQIEPPEEAVVPTLNNDHTPMEFVTFSKPFSARVMMSP
jgi:hypothetical protein